MTLRVVRADLADPGHARGVLAVLDGYSRDPRGGGRPLAPDVRERLLPALRERSDAVVLLALDGERAVGAAVCFEGFSTFAARPLLNLHDLAVQPDARGRGVARALLDGVEAAARERGCCKLTLEVREDNARARGVYARFGFAAFTTGGDATPTLFLEKRLDAPPGSAGA